jgi:Barstar (barnase inhibitor)
VKPMDLSSNLSIIDPEQADEIMQEAVRCNIPVYLISTDQRVGREAFFDAVRSALPLDPPLMSARSWEALSDSLWEGIRSLGSKHVVALWPDSSLFSEGAPCEFDIATSVLADVARSLADPEATRGRPVEMSIYIGRLSGSS